MSQDLIDDKSTLAQAMAWCCLSTSNYLNQCWLKPMSWYDTTRPQWVNLFKLNGCHFWDIISKHIFSIPLLPLICCSWWFSWQLISIGWNNDIIWIKGVIVYWHKYASLSPNGLKRLIFLKAFITDACLIAELFGDLWSVFQESTHRPLNKVAAISQTTFSNAFSWINMFEFWLKFHWSFVPKAPTKYIFCKMQSFHSVLSV